MISIIINNREITITPKDIEELNYTTDGLDKVLAIFQKMNIIQSYERIRINPFINHE